MTEKNICLSSAKFKDGSLLPKTQEAVLHTDMAERRRTFHAGTLWFLTSDLRMGYKVLLGLGPVWYSSEACNMEPVAGSCRLRPALVQQSFNRMAILCPTWVNSFYSQAR
jgi:hypothetical protein